MLKRFLVFIVTAVLAGCGGGPSPWDSRAPEAQKAPRPLVSQAAAGPQAVPEQQPYPDYIGTVPYQPPSDSEFGIVIDGSTPAVSVEQPFATPALPPVKVALLVPLSGKHAHIGEAMLEAAQMAVFDLGYANFQLMPQDTQGTADGARNAAESAIRSGAQLILGPVFSASVKAVSPVVRRHNINMISFSTDWTQAGGNTFIMGFVPFSQVRRITEYAAASGISRIGILAPNTEYGNAVIATYNSLAYRSGLTTADVVRYPPGEKDISGVVRSFTRYDTRIDENKKIPPDEILPFDAVLLPAGGEEARTIANLLSYYEMGPRKIRRLGTGLWDDTSLAAEPALQGALFAAPSPEQREGFERRYASLYGYSPPRIATLAYDATALAAVLARTGYERTGRPAFSREAMTNPNGFSGLDGVFRFRPDGVVERGLAVLEFSNGRIVVRDPAPKTFERWGSQ